jgi:hypothetical protein
MTRSIYNTDLEKSVFLFSPGCRTTSQVSRFTPIFFPYRLLPSQKPGNYPGVRISSLSAEETTLSAPLLFAAALGLNRRQSETWFCYSTVLEQNSPARYAATK